MVFDENTEIQNRIEKIRDLIEGSTEELLEAVSLARSIVYDIRGDNHPLMGDLDETRQRLSMRRSSSTPAIAACRSVIALYEEGGLRSPRMEIAHEIEGDILDIAQKQVEMSEGNTDATHKQLQIGIAAFLAGAALEDALRRLCDASGISYPQRTSISKLREALYQPLEVISGSDNTQITAWGDARNEADHGRFSEITALRGSVNGHWCAGIYR